MVVFILLLWAGISAYLGWKAMDIIMNRVEKRKRK